MGDFVTLIYSFYVLRCHSSCVDVKGKLAELSSPTVWAAGKKIQVLTLGG